MATDLYHLPSRKKHPLYYQMIDEPIDLTIIENRILSGEYHSIDMFERDVMKLFQNVEVKAFICKLSETDVDRFLTRNLLNVLDRHAHCLSWTVSFINSRDACLCFTDWLATDVQAFHSLHWLLSQAMASCR